jgi:restriction system protein
MAKQLAKSIKAASKTVYAAFQILKANGGEMRGRDIVAKIPEIVEITDWEKERYEKTGYIRWESILSFYTIDCMKAGFLQKDKGIWILTPEGEEAMKLGEEGLFRAAKKAYVQWKSQIVTPEKEIIEDIAVEENNEGKSQKVLIEQSIEKAIEGIQDFINKKNPYEFQDLVAGLLRAMGYFIAFNAKRGKDGGTDIIAYSDPLGTKEPRMKVQVKHRPNDAVSVDVVKQLVANLNKSGDVGLFVTSGRFTNESERYSRESHKHIELIDFERLVSLWQEFYPKMTDEEKNMLPLQPIYFLGVNE